MCVGMTARKRGRSPDAFGALFDSGSDAASLLLGRKHACTLFNNGLRRRPAPPLQGGWNFALPRQAGALVQGFAHMDWNNARSVRSEECGLFNGALRQQATGPCTHLVDKDGHVLASSVQDMAARQQRIGGRFHVLGEVGRGAFGVCLKGWDASSKSLVAVKMVRRGHRHNVDAIMEAEKLQILRWRDKEHKFCVRVVSFFQYHGHFCLVTELLGTNLHSALRDLRSNGSGRPGVSVGAARRLAFQLCEALQFLCRSRLIHADLKTENLCLARPGSLLFPTFCRVARPPHATRPSNFLENCRVGPFT